MRDIPAREHPDRAIRVINSITPHVYRGEKKKEPVGIGGCQGFRANEELAVTLTSPGAWVQLHIPATYPHVRTMQYVQYEPRPPFPNN